MSKKTQLPIPDTVHANDTIPSPDTDSPVVETGLGPVAEATLVEAAPLTLPTSGGSWRRMPDGSLKQIDAQTASEPLSKEH